MVPESAAQRRRQTAAYLVLFALVIAVRWISLDAYPRITADEGGWPLSVRNWVESGVQSKDYYMAPGYHWLLGIPFRLFGALHSVARPVSVLVSLLTLFLFHRLTRRLAGPGMAFWSTLLLGTCYPAVLIDRRALMEPFQIALMTGLSLAVVALLDRPAIARGLLVAGLTAALLLTKASGLFLLPALAASALWPWKRPLPVLASLAAGTAIAAAVFWSLYLSDQAGFLAGWTTDIAVANVPGAAVQGSAGRFAFNPVSIETTIRWFSEYEPLLFGISVLGLLKAVWDRQHGLMAGWYVLGAAFLFMQIYVQGNHRAVVLPPLCFFAAYLLCELHLMLERIRPQRFSWAQAAGVLIVCYSVARLGAGILRSSNPDAPVLSWMAAHAKADSRVMAAPYLLMQLGSRPVPFWSLGPPFVPTPEALRLTQPDWLIVDADEWRNHQQLASNRGEIDRALAECCELAYSAGPASIYRVKQLREARSPLRPSPTRGAPHAWPEAHR
jgi:4-amino-4-deoxy-L-arabinose transferase-like glycosyltransferase